MRTILTILVLVGVATGCTYDPWRNESYQCKESNWVASHNYRMALQNREEYKNILIDNVVVKPYLVPSGGFYNGASPYRLSIEAFSQVEGAGELVLRSILYRKSNSQDSYSLTNNAIVLDLSSGYADHFFQEPIELDYDDHEFISISISFEYKHNEISSNTTRAFEFLPILQKGLFKSLQ